MSDGDSISVAIVCSIICGLIIGGCGGCEQGEKSVRREAIRHGVAIYVADPHGEPRFEWILPKGSK